MPHDDGCIIKENVRVSNLRLVYFFIQFNIKKKSNKNK